MKTLIGLAMVPVIMQGAASIQPSVNTASPSCVPTEPMPIAGLHKSAPERMPIFKVDSSFDRQMVVVKLIPCYLVDSAPARRPVSR